MIWQKYVILGSLSLTFCQTNAQTKNFVNKSINYFNNFQRFLYVSPNIDSAFYYVQKLASNETGSGTLRELIHNSFAQRFIESESNDSLNIEKNTQSRFGQELLLRMKSSGIKRLRESVLPIYLLSEIQNLKNNQPKLISLTNEFINGLLKNKDVYKNYSARYGLMIYKIIFKQNELTSLAQKLFSVIDSELSNNQVTKTTFSSNEELERRAWYRYLYSYVNYIKANKLDDPEKKAALLKKSFYYSPDLTDENYNSAYFYDKFFLDYNEKNYYDDYMKFLKVINTDKKEILSTLLKIALANPNYKKELKSYYEDNFSKQNFDIYWEVAVNNNAMPAFPISLKLLNEELFSSRMSKGKWTISRLLGNMVYAMQKRTS